MAKRKVKMVDIVRSNQSAHSVDSTDSTDSTDLTDSTWKTQFLTKNKKHHKDPDKDDALKILNKKIERFEGEGVDVFNNAGIRRKKNFKILFGLILALALVSSAVYAAVVFLPRAEIKIIVEKLNWEYYDFIIADKNISEIDLIEKKIPAQVFSKKKNNNLLFPATGIQQVNRRATGKIVIYNAHSSSSQLLVANTRFLTPDGKTFRLNNRIVVPGAKIIEGKIVPSSIEAKVTADRLGEESNIGPIKRFSIPGFRGLKKYHRFHGESKEPMTGGFIGEVAAPTAQDIKKAKEKNRQIIQQVLVSFIDSQIPVDFEVIEESKQFKIIKEVVNEKTDIDGNFSVFSEAESLVIAFLKEDTMDLMVALSKKDLRQGFELKEYQLNYGIGQIDFNKGQMLFPVDFQGVFWQPINLEEFRELIKNKKEPGLRDMIFALPGAERAVVSFWPFWVNQVTNNIDRILVILE